MSTDAYLPQSTRYDAMPYRRAGDSGLRLPPISLGLWQNFGEDRNPHTMQTIVRRAFDLGVTHFDVSNTYGPPPGAAERHLGSILSQDFSARRHELVVSTKAGWDMWDGPYGEGGSRKHLLTSIDHSLERLGLDYVDIFYHHREGAHTPLGETMRALADIVRSGKALYVGLSNYSAEAAREATQILVDLGVPPVMYQNQYSMFSRAPERGLLDVAKEFGVGVAAFSPLQQGLLTDRYRSGVPQGSRAASQHSSLTIQQTKDPLYQERVAALGQIAHSRHQSLAQMALNWALRDRTVATAIVGASSRHQLEQNVDSLRYPELSAEELEHIEKFAIDGTGALVRRS